MELESKTSQAMSLLRQHACQFLDQEELELLIKKYLPYLEKYPDDIIAIANDKAAFSEEQSAQSVWRKYTDPNRLPAKDEISDIYDLHRILRGDKVYINGNHVTFGKSNVTERLAPYRVPSGYFYLLSILFFYLGFLEYKNPSLNFGALSISLVLLIYPTIRFLTGGRDGFLPAILSIAIVEYFKRWLMRKIDEKDKNRT